MYTHTHMLVPAVPTSIAADMVEVSASTNPLAVNLTVSYVSGDSITHTYPSMHINRVSPCMQGKVGCRKAVQVLITFIQEGVILQQSCVTHGNSNAFGCVIHVRSSTCD